MRRRYLHALFLLLVVIGASARPTVAQETADFFRQNCMSCHTIGGGRLTGPDLQNVQDRQDAEWLVRFMTDPRALIDGGDAYALQLYEDARRVLMPTIPGMTDERARALLALIEFESSLELSQFRGLQVDTRPFTAADVAKGRSIFTGNEALTAGGASCLSCHTVRGLGGLGGGRLGPDLSRVYERLGGRRNLGAWLVAPATATMGPLLRDHPLGEGEIFSLLAFFEQTAVSGGEDDTVALLNVFFLAVGGLALTLAVFDALWKRRFRAVRAPLVDGRQGVR